MAGSVFTTGSTPIADINFNGGLNTTSGPLSLSNSESSDLQNIDFNTFGSILKRNGYTALNTTAITSSPTSDGLWWYEYYSSGYQSKLIDITNAKFYKMDDLDGTWDDITGSTTITAGNFCSFENWNNTVYVTNGTNPPFKWSGSGNCAVIPALVANTYTFKVTGVSVAPAVGDTYTNNAVTYTITALNLVGTAGSILATGSGAPTESGNLVRATGTGTDPIPFTVSYANVNITKAKFVVQYNNYLVLGNVTVGSTAYPSRWYWCELRDDTVWLATSFIEVSKDDGQQLVNGVVSGDRLAFFKERAIYNANFTGDNAIPFTLAKSNSSVGCVAPFSIQEVENGLVFLSYDGFYYYDGNNSYKISTNITTTLQGYNKTRFYQARSMRQKNKQRYFCSLPGESSSTNNVVIVWDWLLNAWSKYSGIAAASMTSVYISGIDERIYFADYAGFAYRMDTGTDDYPLNVQTAIDAYYYTNWKHYDDICDQKGVANAYIFFQLNTAVLTLVYSYDFQTSDTYSLTFSTSTSTDVYGVGLYGTAVYASDGGSSVRKDLTGRGRVVRVGFKNSTLGETFQIDGLGTFVHLETNA